jgi:choline kinase
MMRAAHLWSIEEMLVLYAKQFIDLLDAISGFARFEDTAHNANEPLLDEVKRTQDEQFYSEAAFSFDIVKRAWRNPTMHVDKSYSAERAEEILTALKSFMVHLSTKIHE